MIARERLDAPELVFARNSVRIESARWNVPAVSDATPKGKTSS
jgi:hypothetical protein